MKREELFEATKKSWLPRKEMIGLGYKLTHKILSRYRDHPDHL